MGRQGTGFRLTGAVMLAAALAGPAMAHPHVLVEGTATLNFDDSLKVPTVTVTYALDQMTTSVLVEGLDADGNGIYEPEELQALAAENAVSLAEFDYFLEVASDGARVPVTEAVGYDYRYVDERMVLMLELKLEHPIDPAAERVAIRLYDPTFYVLVEVKADGPLLVRGTEAAYCRVTLKGPAQASDGVQLSDAVIEGFDPNASIGRDYADEIGVACGGDI